jgi:hypothetical protein
MATPTGSFRTYNAVGNREDLADMIYDISPTQTPFMSNVKRGKATATFHEWQTDVLATASATNANVEGNDAATDTATATVRLANYCQIADKVPRVTGTQDAVDKAGRRSELSYQIAKRGKELKRDIEMTLCGVQAANVGGPATTARACAGVAAFLWDNQVDLGTTATTVTVTSGAPTTAPTAGTATAVTEANLKSAMAAAWTDGGEPNMVLCGAVDKQRISAFSGIATQYRDNPQAGPATIIGAADVYVSDFGTVNVVPTRFIGAGQIYVLDTSTWCVDYLRPIQQFNLAKTGDSEQRQILAEFTLKAESPSANAKIYTTTQT